MKRTVAGIVVGWVGAALTWRLVVIDRKLQAEAEMDVQKKVGRYVLDEMKIIPDMSYATYLTYLEYGRAPEPKA